MQSNDSPNSEPPIVSTRTLNAAIQQAKNLTYKIKQAYNNNEFRTWAEMENMFGLQSTDLQGNPFSDAAKQQPIAASIILSHFLDSYVKNTYARLIEGLNQTKAKATKLTLASPEECWRFPADGYRLFEEQHPAFELIYDILFTQNRRAAINNGGTGSGKTALGIALCDKFIRENKHRPSHIPIPLPYPVLWLTVKNAKEQTKERLREFGLSEYVDSVIHVLSYSELTSSACVGRLTTIRTEDVDMFDPDKGQIETIEWLPQAAPLLVICDESHKLARAGTRMFKTCAALRNFTKSYPFFNTRWLFMSGTLAEKISDLEFIATTSDVLYSNQTITPDNFRQVFANPISNGRPDIVNAEAMKRAFAVFSPIFAEIPYFPWPYKAINAVRYYKFKTAEDKVHYDQSWDRYVTRCEVLGKDAESNLRYGPLLMFRKDVEPLRAVQIADDMHNDIINGYSPGMGTAFTGSIIKAVFHLIDTYGYTRDDMSIIWGGRQNIRPTRILNAADIAAIVSQALESGDGISPEVNKLITNNLLWQEDRLLFGDATSEDQNERYQRLLDLRLIGLQNIDKRKAEIDRFMSGRAKMVFYTAQSGGTGLSLEHKKNSGNPRKGYFTPIYSGKEFTQLLGRFPRRNSISDTIQFVCLMANTIESEHVAPILDKKLQALGEFTTRKTDLATLLTQNHIVIRKSEYNEERIRSLEEAIKQAHEDENTQTHDVGADLDEDEDE